MSFFARPHVERVQPLIVWRSRITKFVFALMCLAAAALAAVPVDAEAQGLFAVASVMLLWLLRNHAEEYPEDLARAALIVIGLFVSVRYIVWRFFYTLGGADVISAVCAFLLFAAEVYAFLIHFFGIAVNFYPRSRPALRLDAKDEDVPIVDILVPTYNEPAELLEVTLRACAMIRYPAGKLNIYLCDDGGTNQKQRDADPRKAREAKQRKAELQTMCYGLGVKYVTRARNEHAKAGNLNSCLIDHARGDLVLILDADHVPTADILERTVPWFIKDEKVFLVQTPHFMVNPDPIDRNLLQAFRRMPSENEMFYLTVQKGLDNWDSTFFCGSAALLRRDHLDSIGGLTGETITEDAETALELHSRGLRSVYVDHPMVGGLAPESFSGFVIQRMRWTQGMVQIMLLRLPQSIAKLKWYQAMCYLNSCSFWFFPFARLIFLFAPLAYLFFGLQVYNASTMQILVYTVPHIIASYFITSILFQRTRWPLVSELYEMMQSVYSVRALVQVIRNPRKPSFVVTPKGEVLDDDLVSPLIRPFYALIGLVLLAGAFGVCRYFAYPGYEALTAVVMTWNVVNLLILLASLGALLERKQRRSTPRMPAAVRGHFELATGEVITGIIDDISSGGVRIVFDDDSGKLAKAGTRMVLKVWIPALRREAAIKIDVKSAFMVGRRPAVGGSFEMRRDETIDEVIALMYGDSESWSQFSSRRTRPMPFFKALGIIVRLSVPQIGAHTKILAADARRLFQSLMRRFSAPSRP